MKNLPLLIATIVGTIALVLGVSFFFSSNSQFSGSADIEQLAEGARHTQGANQKNIQVVEFSDFQCPACKASQPLVKDLLTQYGTDIILTFRHMPLDTIHPFARLAAQGSEVAAESGKFWEMHDLLFERQQEWAALSTNSEVAAKLAEYAEELGIDKGQFSERIVSEEIKNAVNLDVSVANKVAVNATPTFFVNGEKVPASQLLQKVGDLVKNN